MTCVDSMSHICSATQMLSTNTHFGAISSSKEEDKVKDKVNDPCEIVQHVRLLWKESLVKV